MMKPDPLPFHLPAPVRDTLDFEGAVSVSHRLEGLLHVGEGLVTLEWTGTTHTERVSFSGVMDEVEHPTIEWLDVPVAWITEVRLRGRWWARALELRVSRLDTFDGVPGARGGASTAHPAARSAGRRALR